VSHVTKSLGGGHGQLPPDLSDIHTSPVLEIVHGHRPGRGPCEGHVSRLRQSGARGHKPIGQVRMHGGLICPMQRPHHLVFVGASPTARPRRDLLIPVIPTDEVRK